MTVDGAGKDLGRPRRRSRLGRLCRLSSRTSTMRPSDDEHLSALCLARARCYDRPTMERSTADIASSGGSCSP